MDKLDALMRIQLEFLSNFVDLADIDLQRREEWTDKLVSAGIEELIEVRRCVNWKYWRKDRKPVDHDQVKEEIVDSLCFVLNLALVWGISPSELLKRYCEKMQTNWNRLSYSVVSKPETLSSVVEEMLV